MRAAIVKKLAGAAYRGIVPEDYADRTVASRIIGTSFRA
jgi:hypothetical protein